MMVKKVYNTFKKDELYKQFFLNAQDAIFLLNRDNLFIYCNPYTLSLFKCTKEDIIGTTPIEWSPELQFDGIPSNKKALDYINKVFSDTPQRFEWIHKRKTGELFYCEVSLNKVIIEGENYLQAIVREITARKYKEEVESIFSRIIDHDSRNIIFSTYSIITLIRRKFDISDKLNYYLKRMENNLDQLLDLIQEFSVIKKMLYETQIKKVYLKEMIEKSIENCKERLEEKNIEIKVSINDTQQVEAGELLVEVFNNLILNSIKHTNCKRIEISSKIDSNNVIIHFSDDGKGIDEELLDKLFKEGRKGVDSKGSGLGLYIVKKIITLYQGSVKVRNKEKGGAEFIIQLKAE